MKPIVDARAAVAALALGAVSLAAPAIAADREFSRVVAGVEQRYGVRRHGIPLLGFAGFCVRVASAGTVKGLKAAVFNGLDSGDEELDGALRDELGTPWRLFVWSHARESGETTFVYARTGDHEFVLLIASLNGGSFSLVKVGMSGKEMYRWIR
jgi:hypothetical protein